MSEDKSRLAGVKMPPRYLAEMFADRVAASKIYKGKDYTDATSLEYLKKGKDYTLMHPTTYRQLYFLLTMLAEKGETKTFRYIRKNVLQNSKKSQKTENIHETKARIRNKNAINQFHQAVFSDKPLPR